MKKVFLFTIAVAAVFTSFSQGSVGVDDLAGSENPISVTVPFLTFAPDSRASAMGDVGVATAADVNSVHWNNGKLAMVEKNLGVSFSYSPWLRNTGANDMSLNYLSFYKKIDDAQTFALDFRYFNLGEVKLRDEGNNPLGIDNPSELGIGGTYSRKLSENMGLGVSFRFIHSNIVSNTTSPDAQAANTMAVDLGWYYRKPIILGGGRESELAFGAHISNLGGKITYSTNSQRSFIPANLRLGSAYKISLDPNNTITLALDLNKLLVPTPPTYELDEDLNFKLDNDGNKIIAKGKDPNRSFFSGTFGSFTDAPGGFSEEIKEFMVSTGAEYWYRDIFAARLGYFNESKIKGNRKYMTLGAGFRYQIIGFDFSYLVPFGQNHPLADTFRLTLMFNFDKKAQSEG